MKKIIYIHHGGAIGGAGICCYYTAKIIKARYNLDVYCYDKPMDVAKMLSSGGVTYKTYSLPIGTIPYFSGGPGTCSLSFFKGILFALLFAMKWKNIIRNESPDLLIANSKLLCWFALLARNLNIKCICFVRETAKNKGKGIWNRFVRWFLEKWDGVIFISEYDRQIENLRHPVTYTIPDFLPIEDYTSSLDRTEACKKTRVSSNTFNLLYVGGVSKFKGFDIAVDALRYLKDKPVVLIIAGQGFNENSSQRSIFQQIKYMFTERIYEKRLKRFIKDNDISKRVCFIGIRKDMADVYAASNVLLFPSRNPHQARPAFEIGAQKKPVIISNYEMTSEYIKDGINGLVFEPCNPESLASAVRRLMDDKSLYEALGENNYKQTMERHLMEKAQAPIYEIIEKIINSELP
jgi:glycosyltransferase involved in cell wall biosynthesis